MCLLPTSADAGSVPGEQREAVAGGAEQLQRGVRGEGGGGHQAPRRLVVRGVAGHEDASVRHQPHVRLAAAVAVQRGRHQPRRAADAGAGPGHEHGALPGRGAALLLAVVHPEAARVLGPPDSRVTQQVNNIHNVSRLY